MDTLVMLNQFARTVADAMNANQVKPIETALCAVMIVVAINEERQPIGGSLNFNDGSWQVDVSAQMSTGLGFGPAEGDEEVAR